MGFAAGFAAGLAVGIKKCGKKSDKWTPPADWLTVPEPGAWEIYVLVETQQENHRIDGIYLYDIVTGESGRGTVEVDWGDGTVETYACDADGLNRRNPSHTYAESKQYLMKVTTTSENCMFGSIWENTPDSDLIIKMGENIVLNSEQSGGSNPFGGHDRLHWVVMKNNTELTGKLTASCFSNCRSLRRLDIAAKITEIPDYCFQGLYNFDFDLDFSETCSIGNNAFAYNYGFPKKSLSFPKVTKIGNNAFGYNYAALTEFSAPNCTEVGAGAFYNNYALEKVTFADGCVFGNNAFYDCINLEE